MIIDCHSHVFNGIYGFHNGCRVRSHTYGRVIWSDGDREGTWQWVPPCFKNWEDLAPVLLSYMDCEGVDISVIQNAPNYTLPDNHGYIHQTISRWPDRFIACMFVDWNQDSAIEELDRWYGMGFRGLDFTLRHDTRFDGPPAQAPYRVNDARYDPYWRKVTELGLPVFWNPGKIGRAEYQVEAFRDLVDRFGIRLVINHMGGMGRQAGSYEGMEGLLEEAKRDGEYDRWLEGVRLAAHPNVYYDIGGYMAVWKRFDRYPYAIYAQWFDLVRAILDEVGIDKVFTGTDWPTVLRRGSYRECWDAVRYDIPFLSDTDRRKILGDNAARAFRTWGILPLGG